MKAIIVDDEVNQRSVMRQLLGQYCPSLTVKGEAENINEAYQLIQKHEPDLIFLDVEMPHGSGFELLKRFDEFSFEVIFVTGFGHYAIQAFEFNALHFIQKPFGDQKLIQAVDKARLRLQEKSRDHYNKILLENLKRPAGDFLDNKIAIPVFEGLEFVRVREIVRCEADAGNTFIHLTNGKRIFSSKHLKEFQRILEEYSFLRPHNSHIVSKNHVKKFLKQDGGMLIMVDDTQIPVSRRRKEAILKAF